jgi:hypothetical protein
MGYRAIEWDVAEVLAYDYTYQYIPPDQVNSNVDKLFALKVRSCSGYFNNNIFIVKPSNINLKQIPLVGEFVLIYKTFNEQSTSKIWREGWYYVTSIDVQSSINENMLPGLSDGISQEEIDNIVPGRTFKRKSVSPLQPYEGDFILEGRFGNSIRFGSSVNTAYPAEYYYKSNPWFTPGATGGGAGNIGGDPIIVLSNRQNNLPGKEFVVENLELDASSLYLTSTQYLDTLTLSKQLIVHNNSFAGSQFVGVADRVVLRAKTDVAVIDSEEGIVLNTPGEIYIGGEDASELLAHGLVLQQILLLLVQAIAAGYTTSGGAACVINEKTIIGQIYDLMPELNSKKYKITKT